MDSEIHDHILVDLTTKIYLLEQQAKLGVPSYNILKDKAVTLHRQYLVRLPKLFFKITKRFFPTMSIEFTHSYKDSNGY